MAAERQDDTPLTFDSPEINWGNANVIESDSSSDSPPVEASADGQPPATAIASPATPPADGIENRDESRPIPFPDHKRILQTERTKHSAELKALEWAREFQDAGATPEEIREAIQLRRGISENGVKFLDAYYHNLMQSPEASAEVRSWAARVLGGHAGKNGNGNGAAPDSIDPDFQHPEDGTPFYSAPKVKALVERIVGEKVKELGEQFAPIRADYDSRQQQRAAEKIYQQHADEARQEHDSLKDSPFFQERKAEIKAHLESTGYKSLKDSYLHVLTTVVIPSLSKTEQAKTIAALQTQAHASVSRPGNAAAQTPAAPKGFLDPSMKW